MSFCVVAREQCESITVPRPGPPAQKMLAELWYNRKHYRDAACSMLTVPVIIDDVCTLRREVCDCVPCSWVQEAAHTIST
eukprot:288656-Prymnesium_polylepis.1